jgi:4-hydroxy-3-polyprenylbenzoate decarboxylase
MNSTDVKRLIVGITGASGVIYGIRLLEVLRTVAGLETHLVMSNAAKRTMQLETDYSPKQLEALPTQHYRLGDIAAAISSGSFKTAGMVVVPCSMKTVSGIATCYSDNLLLRAADVVLKERRKLVLVVRETPLHLGHLRLMAQVTEMGAIVMPPAPAFYHRPKSLDDIINQTVNRILDVLDIELSGDLFERWQGPADRPRERCGST